MFMVMGLLTHCWLWSWVNVRFFLVFIGGILEIITSFVMTLPKKKKKKNPNKIVRLKGAIVFTIEELNDIFI